MSTISDTDLFIVNRGGTDYKITAKDVKEHFEILTPLIVDSSSTSVASWSPYIKCYNYDTQEELDISNNAIWIYPSADRNPDLIFDGDSSTKALYASISSPPSNVNVEVVFAPPGGLSVQSSMTIVAGFHGGSRNGIMSINGEDRVFAAAHDLDPQPFTIDFSGNLEKFAIRQRDIYNGQTAPGIASIALDGNVLINRPVTTMTLKPNFNTMSSVKVGSVLIEQSSSIEAVVSSVDGDTILLDNIYPEFVKNAVIILKQ